jgi:hypothetical protein
MNICSNFLIFNSDASSHQRLCETAFFTDVDFMGVLFIICAAHLNGIVLIFKWRSMFTNLFPLQFWDPRNKPRCRFYGRPLNHLCCTSQRYGSHFQVATLVY